MAYGGMVYACLSALVVPSPSYDDLMGGDYLWLLYNLCLYFIRRWRVARDSLQGSEYTCELDARVLPVSSR